MKYYIISFIFHLALLFVFFISPSKEKVLDSKNVIVYLNQLQQLNGNSSLATAPIQTSMENKEEKNKIEKKEIVKPKLEKKKAVKAVTKTVEKKKKLEKNIEKPQEESSNGKVENGKISEEKGIKQLNGLVKDGSGTYIGDIKSNGGIGYQIKREVNPQYPQMAKKIGFKDEVVIQTKFLVGLDGKVEEIVFLDNFTKYGFRKEVEKALKKWEFEPIIYNGERIKIYFYKDFRFNVK